MVIGLTEYLWKRCADIFLFVIYSKVCVSVLYIESGTFCALQYIHQIWYYSEIISGINTFFEQVYEWHSSYAFEYQLIFCSRVKYYPSFLEKFIFLFPFVSIFFNFFVNDSIFGIISIRKDSDNNRIIPLLFALA